MALVAVNDKTEAFEHDWRVLRQVLAGEASDLAGYRAREPFARLAAFNRASGLVHRALPAAPAGEGRAEDLIRRDFQQAAGLVLNADAALAAALGALDGAGVTCLPFKGAVFRHLLYPDPALRISVDQDLLVAPADFDAAVAALEGAGFELQPFRAGRQVTGQGYHERSLQHRVYRSLGCLIELHRGFGPDERYPIDLDAVLAEAMDLETFCRRIGRELPRAAPYAPGTRFMSPEHDLVHQFAHNAAHNFYLPLMSAVDAKWIVERWRPDWDRVIESARRWHVTTAGYFTLRMARDCMGTAVPDAVLAALEPGAARRLWLERFIASAGRLRPDPAGVPMVTFFTATTNLRLQQALVAFPLTDGKLHSARWAISYLFLRARDLQAHLRGAHPSHTR